MRQKIADLISIQEAMDNLAAIASINMESPSPIGLIGETKIVVGAEEASEDDIRFLAAEGSDCLINALKITYRSVHQYLKKLQGLDLDKEKEGISAMMSLVGESVHKMDAYFAFRFGKDHPKVEMSQDFCDLQKFYSENFSQSVEGKDSWESTWQKENPQLKRCGSELRDFEALLKDKEYELFYIADEGGEPYLSHRLLRNVKLTADFDIESGSFEEDPFFQVKAMLDRDSLALASQILDGCSEEISYFYKIKKKILGFSLAKELSQAIFALYLSANSKHLAQRTVGKTCSDYFHDFQLFLRASMESSEYQKWITYLPDEKERLFLLGLVHRLCFVLVTRECGVTGEAIGLIHRTIRRGSELGLNALTYDQKGELTKLLYDDENIRFLLERFPGGPLLKTLDIIRHEQEEGALIPFDPWIQGNLPSKLYSLKKKGKRVDVLLFASPTRQAKISSVEIIDEFRGFLRYIASSGHKHLLINLQDRLSWQENARSTCLERLQKNAAFSECLIVITLPKNTDFYHQRNGFEKLDQASEFIEAFQDQINNFEESGFFFPESWKKNDLLKFTEETLNQIHKTVFNGEKTLPRQMREAFIEIFYQLLVLEAMDRFEVNTLSFTCKDGIDTGAFASGLFFAFLKAYEGECTTMQSLDALRFFMYWRALSIRERSSDVEQFFRTLSALDSWYQFMEERGSNAAKAVPISWVA